MKTTRLPALLKTAILLVSASSILAGLLLIMPSLVQHRRPFFSLATGAFLLGIGEIVNHPKQTAGNYTDKTASDLRRIDHWSRNPCLMGNLLVIAGIIFLFIAFGRFIFP